MLLRCLTGDEKEEVGKGEEMDGQEDTEDDHKGESSGLNTPRPENACGATPMYGLEKESDVSTPAESVVKKGTTRGTQLSSERSVGCQ